mmetsp:Transcript_89805/g.253273  ORF Transcript_89805/g.253273 Transcript_89805/m.253273 type:complete len:380 (+) Transcript_89805:409-1548(+)
MRPFDAAWGEDDDLVIGCVSRAAMPQIAHSAWRWRNVRASQRGGGPDCYLDRHVGVPSALCCLRRGARRGNIQKRDVRARGARLRDSRGVCLAGARRRFLGSAVSPRFCGPRHLWLLRRARAGRADRRHPWRSTIRTVLGRRLRCWAGRPNADQQGRERKLDVRRRGTFATSAHQLKDTVLAVGRGGAGVPQPGPEHARRVGTEPHAIAGHRERARAHDRPRGRMGARGGYCLCGRHSSRAVRVVAPIREREPWPCAEYARTHVGGNTCPDHPFRSCQRHCRRGRVQNASPRIVACWSCSWFLPMGRGDRPSTSRVLRGAPLPCRAALWSRRVLHGLSLGWFPWIPPLVGRWRGARALVAHGSRHRDIRAGAPGRKDEG